MWSVTYIAILHAHHVDLEAVVAVGKCAAASVS